MRPSRAPPYLFWTARIHVSKAVVSEIRPFRIDVSEDAIERVMSSLAAAHWSYAPEETVDWRYGTNARWLGELVDYWQRDYDWRPAEAALNAWPQFVTEIDGILIHFYHVRGSGKFPRPLILSHGWPGSVLEFQGVIERLAFPDRFGGNADDGFDLVIPSLPGYGFSGRPKSPIGPRKVAAMWRTLMVDGLGYPRFCAQGGDWGAAVTSWLGADHGDVVSAIHLNMIASWVAGAGEPEGEEDIAYRERLAKVQRQESGYSLLQATKPQTIGLALSASPLAFAAWVVEKFQSWGDTHGDIESRFSKETLVTNIMIYLLNDAVTSSLWMYRGRADEDATGDYAKVRIEVPTGVALFPAEFIPYPPRSRAERHYAIASWHRMTAGGHFAALEEPILFSQEVGSFFKGYI